MLYLICLFLMTMPLFAEEEASREELFLSTPEQVATLTSESNHLVGSLISPLSGQPVLRQKDLVVQGAQQITLHRIYVPLYMPVSFPKQKHQQSEYDKSYLYHHLVNHYKGWQWYPHLRLEFYPQSKVVRLSESSGMTLDFQLSESVTALATPPYAISNVSGETPSGKYDPRNTRISCEEGGNKIVVYATDGVTRIYYNKGQCFLLDKEILSNGKVLKYRYDDNLQLRLVESLDPKERYVYSSLSVAGTPREGSCLFAASTGLSVDYGYQKRFIKWTLKRKAGKKHHNHITLNLSAPPILTSVSSPYYRAESLDYCERFLLRSYSGKEATFTILNAGFGEEEQHYRVQQLCLPVGPNDTFKPVYEFSYQPPVAGQREGSTTVKESDGTSTIYHFSKDLLLTLIQYLDQEGSLKKEKVFSWDENHWLKTLEIQDAKKNLLYRKSYQYDAFGNPILEEFTGDLTGSGTVDTYATKRIFSQDGKNLLLREEDEEGKALSFSYLPNTDLVTSKFTQVGDRILLREFFIYDDCNNLIQMISDDGSEEKQEDLSNVTQREEKTYLLRQSAPFLHMPEWVLESYLENGSQKLLKKSRFIYDVHGNIAQEEVYDSDEKLIYTIYKTYNERGDVLSETNRLGQEAHHTYDQKGRLETSLNFSHRVQTTFHHDAQGRLREKIEKGDEGIIHACFSEYDDHDRKIQSRDSFGNLTRYTYDPFVNKVVKTDFPSIAVSTASTYDPFGRELSKTDANGNTTHYRYNAYGFPIEECHPSGGKETYLYTKKGALASHTDPDHITTQFSYDVLGRVLSQTFFSSTQEPLAEETFSYSGLHLLSETDKEGNKRLYTYDGAGRKLREEFCGQRTDLVYNSLGQLSTLCKENTLFIHYKRDLEGKVLEESKIDVNGQVLYKKECSYDQDGNQEIVTRYINGKAALDTFTYDAFHRQLAHQDALGNISRTVYDEAVTNDLDQRVLQTLVTDPRGITRIETEDTLGRVVRKEVLDSQKRVLSLQELIYDANGNVICQRDYVYENTLLKGVQMTQYTHTPENHIASITRALETPEERNTTYTYLPSGKLFTKTLPDGVTLTYTYHPLGPLSHLDSSDGQIHHIFDYDKLGHLKEAYDAVFHIAIKREVDPFGNVTLEHFPGELEIVKSYDTFNRLTSLTLHNAGAILYTYDPLFLREVTRVSPQGEILYSHTYNAYDLDGNLLSESLPKTIGQIVHVTNPKGLKTSLSSPCFSQECLYDSIGNLLKITQGKAEHLYSYDGLSQLSSETNTDYAYDSLYNRIQKNEKTYKVNDLNEQVQTPYDLNGNQLVKQTPSGETFHLSYDPLGRLIEALSDTKKIVYVYDPLGRRLSKTVHSKNAHKCEHYLYHGQKEIGSFDSADKPTSLKILGLNSIGIEIEDKPFVPITDVQGNICGLIDLETKTLSDHYDFTAFGEESQISHSNPWRFAAKRFDPDLCLIDFGKRFYDPQEGRWLSMDPAGFIDSVNLYQYVLNNPFRYMDPDGQFAFLIPLVVWGAEFVIPSMSAMLAPAIYGAVTGAVAYGGYKAFQALNTRDHDRVLIENQSTITSDSTSWLRMERKKKGSVDEKLSDDPLNDPNLEDISHPEAKEQGRHKFKDKRTGEIIEYDEAQPEKTGHRGHEHYHRPNPDSIGKKDYHLDSNGNPTPKGSEESHLYPPEWVWWK